jgi:hypothetical protein
MNAASKGQGEVIRTFGRIIKDRIADGMPPLQAAEVLFSTLPYVSTMRVGGLAGKPAIMPGLIYNKPETFSVWRDAVTEAGIDPVGTAKSGR